MASSNRGVVYVKQGKVEVRSIDFPVMTDPGAVSSRTQLFSKSCRPTSAAPTNIWFGAEPRHRRDGPGARNYRRGH